MDVAARKFSFYSTADDVLKGVDVSGKCAVVTGGNSGIGFETCRALAHAGARVVLCSRSAAAGEEACQSIRQGAAQAQVEPLQLDLADLHSVEAAAKALLAKHSRLDMLICNAGVMACPLKRTAQGLELQMGTNWIGHMHFVNQLLPTMKKQTTPSRIVIVASLAHKMGGLDLSDLNWTRRKYSPWPAYGQSKACNVLHARHLAVLLKDTPIKVFSLHPGNIQTNLQRHNEGMLFKLFFAIGRHMPKPIKTKTIPEGAATQVYAATAPELESHSGEYLDDCAVAPTTKQAADMKIAASLWESGEALIAKALEAPPAHDAKP